MMQPRRLRIHTAGLLRLGAFSLCVVGSCLVASVVSARGEARESALRLGRGLHELRDVLGQQSQLRINGNDMFAGGTHVELPLTTVLDRFEKHCEKSNDHLPNAKGSPSPAQPASPRDSLTFSRTESETEGAVFCLLPPLGQSADFATRVRAFAASHDLHALGDLRYVFARKGAAGGTDVMTIWTEGSFNIRELTTTEGDAPGRDLAEVPRPPHSSRVLDVEIKDLPYGIKSYVTPEAPDLVLARYKEALPKSKWASVPSTEANSSTLSFVKNNAAVIISVQRQNAQTRVDLIQMGSRGVAE